MPLLVATDTREARGARLKNPKVYDPQRLAVSQADAERLWRITDDLAAQHGLELE